MDHDELVDYVEGLYKEITDAAPHWITPDRADLETFDDARLNRIARLLEADVDHIF